MLIVYAQRDEEFEQQAAEATQAEPWLRRWDELLEDEELLEFVWADLAGRYPSTRQAWPALDAGGGDRAVAGHQAVVPVELSANGGAAG